MNSYIENKPAKLPSLAQMLVRMQSGHRKMLQAIRDNRGIKAGTDGEARGYMTVSRTLNAWGCIDQDTRSLSERGNALLDACNEKAARIRR